VFSAQETEGGNRSTTLYFFDSPTSELCPSLTGLPPQFTLYQHHAWLPDGRLLLLIPDGVISVISPCQPTTSDRSAAYPARFDEVVAVDASGGRMLLRGPDSFAILDPISLKAVLIPGVTPNPYEAHWDFAAWSPGGEWVAISRLNGRDARDGSTLFWVDGASGAVRLSLDLRDASDQSAPMVEWLSATQLLLHGQGELYIYDFATDPPQVTPVVRDIFALDLRVPDDFAAWAAFPSLDGSRYFLLLRASHPRDQAIYWYDSHSGEVRSIAAQGDALLFLPDGQSVTLPPLSSGVPVEDRLELYWLKFTSPKPQPLLVEGHLPRAYPHLRAIHLPKTARLAFASEQGVSLVAQADGRLLHFWELSAGSGMAQNVIPAPDETGLLVLADRVGVYWIKIP
jgi:hypothetical protein